MVIHSPQVPCIALFLLLLLPPSLLSAGSLQYHGSGWRVFHHLGKGSRSYHHRHSPGTRHRWYPRQAEKDCQGAFDLYFILDKSGSVNNNWIYIYSLVEDLVNKFKNPNMRMSFVLYSGDAETLMPLTADRKEIEKGLKKLEKVVPTGQTFMQEGFKLVNKQIEKVNSENRDKKPASMIIALTDGTLLPTPFEETKQQANKSRNLGAVVYTVGVLDYQKKQMIAVADSPDHMFGVDSGFEGLKGIVDPLASKTCIEITSVEASTRCAGDKTPTSFNDTSIICPGPVISQPYQKVFLEVSLNNGESFLGNELNITSTNCGVSSSIGNTITIIEKTYDLRFLALLPLLLLLPLLMYCCWRLCYKPIKLPPPVPEKKPEEKPPPPPPPCINTCPTVLVSCCGCGPRVIEGNTDSWCQYINPSCHQLPLTWYHPRYQRRCSNFALIKPQCGRIPCSSKIVLQPSRECLYFKEPPCSPRICLEPSRECFPTPQELYTSGICLQPARECFSMPQTLCTPKIFLKPSRDCLSLNNYPQCRHLPPRYSQSPFSMLPLLPPSARKSIESLGHPYRPQPTSKRCKTKD
ncbi:anthrax toxin receptor-like [Sciurus carolinensis]|uniref:anthrax toxin receptor-like n=1 Tax=Sciurus carolinensis TaxID=30640 RepID=UPI001FB1C71D|nr:anthrax toxin receptor-like [Sciurus carolinensis]